MKKIILLIMCFVPLILSAQSNDEKLWREAADAYSHRDYETAVARYERLTEKGGSAPLYYNYANALFKAGYVGRSILYYERALRLDPSNEDIKFNLEFANLNKIDKIDRVEEFFVVQWYKQITNLLTSNVWAYVSIVLFLLAMIMFLLYRFGSSMTLRKTAFGLFVFFFVFTFITMGHSFMSKNIFTDSRDAIVLVGSETAKSTPDESGTEVFVIHEGTKVRVRSELGEWSEVQLEDGNVGWVRTASFEMI